LKLFAVGNFEPYGLYLKKLLECNLRLYEAEDRIKLDEARVHNSIIQTFHAQKEKITSEVEKQKFRLTDFTLKSRKKEATELFEDNGKKKEYKQKVHDLCISLSKYYSITSDQRTLKSTVRCPPNTISRPKKGGFLFFIDFS